MHLIKNSWLLTIVAILGSLLLLAFFAALAYFAFDVLLQDRRLRAAQRKVQK